VQQNGKPEALITYFDENQALRTTHAIGVKRVAGCIKFTAITPDGQTTGRLQMNENKVKKFEILNNGRNG